MREKIRAAEPMVTADQAREEIRSPLDLLVRHHVERGTPRMSAYGRVGSLIGRSPAWVQRVIGRRADAVIGLHDALNIKAAYGRLCTSIEAAADQASASNDLLREELHAAVSSHRPAPRGASGRAPAAGPAPRGPGRAPARALARPLLESRDPAPPVGVNDLPLWRVLNEGE